MIHLIVWARSVTSVWSVNVKALANQAPTFVVYHLRKYAKNLGFGTGYYPIYKCMELKILKGSKPYNLHKQRRL